MLGQFRAKRPLNQGPSGFPFNPDTCPSSGILPKLGLIAARKHNDVADLKPDRLAALRDYPATARGDQMKGDQMLRHVRAGS